MTTSLTAPTRRIRIGSGAGFSGDRIDPAVDLAARGRLDYLVFECLAERTIALAVEARQRDPDLGYDPLLDERFRAVLPAARRNGVRIISNMGAANPAAAARRVAAIAHEIGLDSIRVAAVVGDDLLDAAEISQAQLIGGLDLATPPRSIISANAYVGYEPVAQALAQGADVVLTGRVADPSLFLAPIAHEFGWRPDDWDRLGRGTVVGHLLECAGQITGGYFADPGFKDVPDMANLGFPIAEVSEDGGAVITKLADAGGSVSVAACTEQLLYELHDPRAYRTPDVIADFSSVRFAQAGPDRVEVSGGGGSQRPAKLKVSVGYKEGFIGEGQISYAGPGSVERGRLALSIIEQRLTRLGEEIEELRLELIGVNSILASTTVGAAPNEVRARVAARTRTLEGARWIGREVEALYTNGPAGGGGVTRSAKEVTAIASTFVDRAAVRPEIIWEGA